MTRPKNDWHYSGDRDYLSYGGYWWRRTGDREVTAIRITNLDEDSDKDLEDSRFQIEQLVIDLDDSGLKDALKTVGWFEANRGKKPQSATISDRVDAMVGHFGSHLREDVIKVKGDVLAEETLEKWKAGVSPYEDDVEGLPTSGDMTVIPFKAGTDMLGPEPGSKIVQVPHGTVRLYDRDRRAAQSSKYGALKVQFIDAYRYQRELQIARKYASGKGVTEGWESHAYMHPGMRHQAEISERVAMALIDRFWKMTTEHQSLLFNPDNFGPHDDTPRGEGFVHFHTRLLLGETPSAKML